MIILYSWFTIRTLYNDNMQFVLYTYLCFQKLFFFTYTTISALLVMLVVYSHILKCISVHLKLITTCESDNCFAKHR